ncbi:MAG TPA: EAL domain-containing protein, partial [Acidiferrobacteraceae bacterium]|nr:EAL domain-containing protein [Acidiferrobacteraceae bacterium]HEX19861.1 EAL domain-containing protein [Acidiferrobacteraceae bacterium]
DALTGLVNRSEFELRLQGLLADAYDQRSVHAMLYLDLDQFKIINDTCGHAAGDAMLKALTGLLQDQVRDSDTLARLGGDEFGILLTGCPLSQAQRIAEDVIQAIKKFRFDWKGVSFETGASIGMVSITSESEDIAKVMSAADMACYMAKDMGRGRVRVYVEDDAELTRRHSEMAWVSRINQAMKDNRFVLFQQDIVALNSDNQHVSHKEVLLRLYDSDGQLIVPDEFIPPAERYNLMPALDRWVIHKSFTEIAKNPSNGCQYSVNLSGTSLNDDDLVDYIQGQFGETGLAPGRICFEITETTAISNLSRAASLIQNIKDMGCLFSLDDFGKGASSFTYLKNLSVDYLKIDGGFVSDFIDDPTDYAIIESINKIGHALGIQTIAECVEDEASLRGLKEIGVNFAQGYIIARPEPLQAA